MNILYACDNNYIWLTGISMISLYENNRQIDELSVYLLGDGISDENKRLLNSIAQKYERKCSIIDLPDLEIPQVLCSSRWPKSAFSRLFAGQYLPCELDKILYLDCDTIISGDVSPIWNMEMGACTFLGVKDCIGGQYRKNLGLSEKSVYVNAGVLLIDLKQLRMLDIVKTMDSYLKKYINNIYYADQDILNGMFDGKIGILPAQYDVMSLQCLYDYESIKLIRKPQNYYTKSEVEAAVKEPKIIHYTTCMLSIRPWFSNTNHPFADEFNKYMAMSPWREKQLDEYQYPKNKKTVALKFMHSMPNAIGYRMLGLVHSVIVPILKR